MNPGNDEIFDELLPAFGADFAERARRLEEFLASLAEEFDSTLVESAARDAHTLRGSALVLGLVRAPDTLAEIEQALARSRTDESAVDPRPAALLRELLNELGSVASTPEQPHRQAEPESRLRRYRVLCIDDHPPSATLVERALSRRPDLEVTVAETAAAAIEHAVREVPDLVLLDLRLPDLSGEELLRRLRETPSLRAVPVVVLSAGADDEQIERLRGAGIVEYLPKPLDVRRLLELVEAVLPRRVARPV